MSGGAEGSKALARPTLDDQDATPVFCPAEYLTDEELLRDPRFANPWIGARKP